MELLNAQLHMTVDLRNTQIFEFPSGCLELFFRNFNSLFDFFFTPLALEIDISFTKKDFTANLHCNFSWEVCPEVHYLEMHYSSSYQGLEPTSNHP